MPNLSPFCIWLSDAAPKIEKHKNLISVRNCKKCYLNRERSSCAVLREPKSAILHCYWCPFVSNDSSLSSQKFIFQSTFFAKLRNKWYFKTFLKAAFVKCDTSQEFTHEIPYLQEAGPGPIPTPKMQLLMTVLKLTTFSCKLLLQKTSSLLLVDILDLLEAE